MPTANPENEKGGFITIQPWMVKRLGLKSNELIIYALIHGFSQDGHSYFYGSIRYIMDSTNLSKETVLTVLQSLVRKSLVIKKDVRNYQLFDSRKVAQGGQHFCLYYTAVSRGRNFAGQETRPAGSENLTGAGQKSVPAAGQEFRPNNLLDTKFDTATAAEKNGDSASGRKRRPGILKESAEAEDIISQELKKLFGGHLVFDSEFVPEISRLAIQFGIGKKDIPSYLKFAFERTSARNPKSLTNLFHAMAKSPAVMQDFTLLLKKEQERRQAFISCPACGSPDESPFRNCGKCGFDMTKRDDTREVTLWRQVTALPPGRREAYQRECDEEIQRLVAHGFLERHKNPQLQEQFEARLDEIRRKYGITGEEKETE